jgi:(heptosyl)LPS beta-1,4-glucosyltransferase
MIMPALTVIILTKNEEQFIERCIRSVSWADEVLVIDSGSSDRTREIAASLGANVYEQEWLGWPGQRSKAVSIAENDWVFFVEADEIVTPELARSIGEVLSGSMNEHDAYSVDRRGDFYGLLLPNMSNARRRRNFVRMFNRRCSAYDAAMIIHEEVRFPGKAIPLRGVLIHWRAFTMDEYIKAFNRNATAEAQMLNEKGRRATGLRIFLWPVLRFGWNYVVKGGARFGTRGLIHAMLQATSEYIRYAKLWEMQNATRELHPPAHIYQGTHHSVSTAPQRVSKPDREIKNLAQQ